MNLAEKDELAYFCSMPSRIRSRAGFDSAIAILEDESPASPALAHALLQLCRNHRLPMIVNDDPRLAAEIEADGVHLGREDSALRREVLDYLKYDSNLSIFHGASEESALDEPSANLDPAGRRELAEVLDRLSITMLMVTHDLELARKAQRILVLDAGRICDLGTLAAGAGASITIPVTPLLAATSASTRSARWSGTLMKLYAQEPPG